MYLSRFRQTRCSPLPQFLALSVVLLSVAPTLAQPGLPPKEPVPAADPERPVNISARPTVELDLYDPDQLNQAVHQEMVRMDFEDTLQSKISVSFQRADAQAVADAVRLAGFMTPVEVRGAPKARFSLSVNEVPVRSVLDAAAVFSGCQLYVLSDHLLIAPTTLLTPDEARYTGGLQGGWQRMRVLSFGLVTHMKKLGKTNMSVGDMSAAWQQIAQRFEDNMDAASGMLRSKVAADTMLTYEPGPYGDLTDFTLRINFASGGIGHTVKMIDSTTVRRTP